MDHNLGHRKIYLSEVCFEISGVRLLYLWPLNDIDDEFSQKELPGKGNPAFTSLPVSGHCWWTHLPVQGNDGGLFWQIFTYV